MTQDIYVMRVWHSPSENEHRRVTVIDTQNQQKYHFANLEKLLEFFRERLKDEK